MNILQDSNNQYLPGEQTRVTPLVASVSQQFKELSPPDLFNKINDYIFSHLTILPYNKSIKEYEKKRRWKLTATQVLEIGTIVDTKYCNDVVSVFIAIVKALGYKAKLIKLFRFNRKEKDIEVHSLALIEDNDRRYVANVRPGDYFSIYELDKKVDLTYATQLQGEWRVWKIADDQWSMFLTDSSQESSTIVADAKKYFSKRLGITFD